MAKKKYSDGYMLKLWRQAVKSVYGDRCFLCDTTVGPIEAHHIKPRAGRLLRYAVENGVPLCRECHRRAHRDKGRLEIRAKMDPEVLADIDFFEDKTLKDFLPEVGITKDDYYLERVEELKRIIEKGWDPW